MTVSGLNDRITTQKGIESVDSITSRSAVGMGIPVGIPMGMVMGWVWRWKFRPYGSPDNFTGPLRRHQ